MNPDDLRRQALEAARDVHEPDARDLADLLFPLVRAGLLRDVWPYDAGVLDREFVTVNTDESGSYSKTACKVAHLTGWRVETVCPTRNRITLISASNGGDQA